MSFTDMQPEDLLSMAREQFGVEVDDNATPAQIIAALESDGVTWEQAVQFDETAKAVQAKKATEAEKPAKRGRPAKAAEEVPAEEPAMVPLRMMRENRRYDIRGYTFTHDEPFVLVDEDNATWITQNVDGFRYATPKELKEFYS